MIETDIAELVYMEGLLTSENVERVILYNTNISEHIWFILGPMYRTLGHPFSNAYFLHELEEVNSFFSLGYDFLNVVPTEDFRRERDRIYDTIRAPHLDACLLHCKYLMLKAREIGINFSLGTAIKFDPFSSPQNKQEIHTLHPDLVVDASEEDNCEDYFCSLVSDRGDLFDPRKVPFKLGNGSADRYIKRAFRRHP